MVAVGVILIQIEFPQASQLFGAGYFHRLILVNEGLCWAQSIGRCTKLASISNALQSLPGTVRSDAVWGAISVHPLSALLWLLR